MLKKSHLSFLFLLSFLLLQCTRDFSVQPIKGQVRQLTPLEKQVVESDNAFGLKLFKELIKAEPDKNVFISPLSVAMALGMTYNGAAGSTEEAMRNTLEFGNMSFQEINESFQSLIELLTQLDPKVRFQIANSIWYRLGFQVEQDFIDLNKKYFGAEVRSLDFSSPSSVDIINNWVDEKTNSKIDKIIDNIDPMTMMFLINAIYFKGMWTYEFDKNMTSDEQFTKPDGSQVPCKMMKMTADLNYFADETVQIVDLPYGDGQFSMTVILPRSDQSIDAVAADLTPSQWTEWLSKLTKASGTVELPKFKLEYEKPLSKSMRKALKPRR